MARAIQCRVDAGRGAVRFRGTTPFAGNDYAVEVSGADSASAVLYLMSDDGLECLAKTRTEGGVLRISLATRPLRDAFERSPHEVRLFHCLVREEAAGAAGHVVAEGDMAVAWNPLWDAAAAPGGYTMEGPAGPRGERGEADPKGDAGAFASVYGAMA